MFCDENHSGNRCVKITDPHDQKWFLRSNGHCFIYFEKSHVVSSCKQNYKCNKCNGRRHISVCTFLSQRIAHRLCKIDNVKILKVLPRLLIEILLQTNFQLIEIIF